MFIRFPDAFICRVSGKHAAQYLQNRLTNDIRALAPGKGSCEAAALTPQGKIGAVVTVSALTADTFLVTADGGNRTETLQALSQFKVAERVDFTDISESHALLHLDGAAEAAIWEIFSPQAKLPLAGTFETIGDIHLLSRPRFSGSGVHIVLPIGSLERALSKLNAGSRELSGDALTLARVSKGIPSFPEELNSELLLSETGRTDLVSFTKGCYVGQEVVAKIDAVGRAPRTLVTFRSDSAHGPKSGATITGAEDQGGRALGKVITAVLDPADKKVSGFAVLKSERAKSPGSLTADQCFVSVSGMSSAT